MLRPSGKLISSSQRTSMASPALFSSTKVMVDSNANASHAFRPVLAALKPLVNGLSAPTFDTDTLMGLKVSAAALKPLANTILFVPRKMSEP